MLVSGSAGSGFIIHSYTLKQLLIGAGEMNLDLKLPRELWRSDLLLLAPSQDLYKLWPAHEADPCNRRLEQVSGSTGGCHQHSQHERRSLQENKLKNKQLKKPY